MTSSAPSVVGVKPGGAEIEAKKVGTATIILASSDGGATSTFEVNVVKKIKDDDDPPLVDLDDLLPDLLP